MTKLSNSDSRTIRLAREAIGLVIDGAMRRLESQYGPNDDADRGPAADALILHARQEIEHWETRFESGAAAVEMTADESALVDHVPRDPTLMA